MSPDEDGNRLVPTKRYKTFMDANYKPECIHPFTDKKWRRKIQSANIGKKIIHYVMVLGYQNFLL